MRMLSRSIAVAALIVCASSLPSNAVSLSPTSTFGGLGGTAFFGNSVGGGFTDDYVFTLTGAGSFVASITATNAFTATAGFIDHLALAIFSGAPPAPGSGPAGAGPAPTIIPNIAQFIALTTPLAAGTYFLHVTGSGITGDTAAYGGSISFSDPPGLPLPGSLSLFAAGLGLLGWLGRVRKRKFNERISETPNRAGAAYA